MRRVLVTGGAGFIGSNVVKNLLTEAQAEVVVLDNLSSGFKENLAGFDVSFIEGDVRNEALVRDAMSGCDTVFHLAASVGNIRSIAYPIEDSEINVIGTLRVLEAARELGVHKVVFSSSAGIFGELKTLPIREDHAVEPDSPYGASKLCAEKLCLSYSKLYSLECVCLRYFNVYGINQRYDAYGNVIPIFAHRLLHDLPLLIYGDGKQTRDFIDAHDVAQANCKAALAQGVTGAFNIASGTRITINRLAELMCEVSGIRGEIEHGPPRKGDVRHSLADISAAEIAFGYEPTKELEEGLAEYMQWARKEML
jgi:UDP-glucose 4-epimerase